MLGRTVGLDAGRTVGVSLCADVTLRLRALQKLQCPALILTCMMLRPAGKGNVSVPVPSFSKTQLLALQRRRQCW